MRLVTLHSCFCGTTTLTLVSAGFTLQFLTEMGATLGPEQVVMHPSTVKEEIKHHYLEFLRERGLVGLYEFLCTFITTLAVRPLSPARVLRNVSSIFARRDCEHEIDTGAAPSMRPPARCIDTRFRGYAGRRRSERTFSMPDMVTTTLPY